MERSTLAVITGAARRLGSSMAIHLAENGYAILLHYWTSDGAASRTESELRLRGVPVFPVKADLKDPKSIELISKRIDETGLGVSVLINSASVMPGQEIGSISHGEWDDVMSVNLRAPFFLSQMIYRKMADGGVIINITDVGVNKSWTGYPAYVVSKSALESLTRIMARAYAPRVRVNAIAPGLVLKPENMQDNEWSGLISRLPLKCAVSLSDINSAVSFIIRTRSLTGQTVTIDGGWSL